MLLVLSHAILLEADRNTLISGNCMHFLPVCKIEAVDPIKLEPQSSIKLRKHIPRQEQLESSGQLSMNEGWGALIL